MAETINIPANQVVEVVSIDFNEQTDVILIDITEVVEVVNIPVSENVTVLIPPAFEDMVNNLKAITVLENVTLGNLETVQMPAGNPNVIGIVQQIDEDDGDRVYYPNFTTTPDGRSAIFVSVLTKNQNKIVIWPKEA